MEVLDVLLPAQVLVDAIAEGACALSVDDAHGGSDGPDRRRPGIYPAPQWLRPQSFQGG